MVLINIPIIILLWFFFMIHISEFDRNRFEMQSQCHSIDLFEVHLPHSNRSDEKVEDFYEQTGSNWIDLLKIITVFGSKNEKELIILSNPTIITALGWIEKSILPSDSIKCTSIPPKSSTRSLWIFLKSLSKSFSTRPPCISGPPSLINSVLKIYTRWIRIMINKTFLIQILRIFLTYTFSVQNGCIVYTLYYMTHWIVLSDYTILSIPLDCS